MERDDEKQVHVHVTISNDTGVRPRWARLILWLGTLSALGAWLALVAAVVIIVAAIIVGAVT